MTEFFEINFGAFCSSMALLVRCYLPSIRCTANLKFVFLSVARYQSHCIWALVSSWDAFCLLSFHNLHELVRKMQPSNEYTTIGICKINPLLFADDLILLSSTESGLQRALMTLQVHATLLV